MLKYLFLKEVIDRFSWRGIGLRAIEVKVVEPFYITGNPIIKENDFLGFELDREILPDIRKSIVNELNLLGYDTSFDTSRNREQLHLKKRINY